MNLIVGNGILFSIVIAVFFIFSLVYGATDTLESDLYESREIKVYISHGFGHDLHQVNIKPRGVVTIKNFRGPKFSFDQEELSLEEISKLETLANEDGYYFLVFSIKTSNGEKTFNTFYPAKSLLESNLSDEVRLHLNPAGDIFSIGYHTRKPPVVKPGTGAEFPVGHRKPPTQRFSSILSIKQGEIGPVPDTGPYLEKLEMERLARERGDDGRDNRSFLAKYWMYIVPVAVLVLLSSAQNPEGAGS